MACVLIPSSPFRVRVYMSVFVSCVCVCARLHALPVQLLQPTMLHPFSRRHTFNAVRARDCVDGGYDHSIDHCIQLNTCGRLKNPTSDFSISHSHRMSARVSTTANPHPFSPAHTALLPPGPAPRLFQSPTAHNSESAFNPTPLSPSTCPPHTWSRSRRTHTFSPPCTRVHASADILYSLCAVAQCLRRRSNPAAVILLQITPVAKIIARAGVPLGGMKVVWARGEMRVYERTENGLRYGLVPNFGGLRAAKGLKERWKNVRHFVGDVWKCGTGI